MNRRSHTARIVVIMLMLCAAADSGCAGNPAEPSSLPLGHPFELRAGASATLENALTITFDRVTSDSRCPMDARCIQAGDAIVAILVSQGAGAPVARELHTDPRRSEASYLTYSIKLVTLEPYPRTDRQIRPEDYVAVLTVSAQ